MDRVQEAQFAAFVQERWRDLVRAAVFLGAEAHEAEDLAQSTLVRCYSGWDRVSGADNRDAYVYRILVNTLRDARRSRWWKSRVDFDLDGIVEDHGDAVAITDAVHCALAGLSKGQREVVVLRYLVQLTEEQTADVLKIPAGTVKSRLSRGLAALAGDPELHHVRERS